MEYLTIISAVASILGFVLTVANVFPTQAKVRNYVTIFSLGIFIGSFFSSIKHISINFPENPLSAGTLLFYICSLIGLFFLIIAAIFSEDKEKRVQCFEVAGTGFFVLVFVGMLILLFSPMMTMDSNAKKDISLDEWLIISNSNINKGNFDRAIRQLEIFSNLCPAEDPRKQVAQKKIEEIKRQETSRMLSKE